MPWDGKCKIQKINEPKEKKEKLCSACESLEVKTLELGQSLLATGYGAGDEVYCS